MNRLLLALALSAALTAGGCRALYPHGGQCGDPGCGCGCPAPYSCSEPSCGCHANVYDNGCADFPLCNCQNCGMFNRYCGCCECAQAFGGDCCCGACDGGWSGDYDCSPYAQGAGQCGPGCLGPCGCCGAPGPGCCCASGDHVYNFAPGPPTGQTAYPYYTVRGPRDFLRNNPPPLGPY